MSDIINGERAITEKTALRFARFFGNSPQFWFNLQGEYNLRISNSHKLRSVLDRDVLPTVKVLDYDPEVPWPY